MTSTAIRAYAAYAEGVPARTLVWFLILTLATVTVSGCAPIPIDRPSGSGGSGGSSTAEAQNAADRLDRLRVARAGSMRGYTRDRFGQWRDTGENCNVRDSVLKRDGRKVKTSGCNVVAGTWLSGYDGRTLDSPTEVDIDHVVPLANAWRSGASAWTGEKREDFANDLDHPQLAAVSRTSNRAKGDQDPSSWRPSSPDRWCGYAADWIEVKTYWKLTVTRAERAALADMLEEC
jgi:hypothetical protein